jgi:hypothetical protein
MANSIFSFFRSLFGKSASVAAASDAKTTKPPRDRRDPREDGTSGTDKTERKSKPDSASRNGKKQKKSKQKQRPVVVSQSGAKPIAKSTASHEMVSNAIADTTTTKIDREAVAPLIERPQVEPIFEPMRNLRTLRQVVSARSNTASSYENGSGGSNDADGSSSPSKQTVSKSQVTRLERKNVLPDKVRTYEGFETPVLQVPRMPKADAAITKHVPVLAPSAQSAQIQENTAPASADAPIARGLSSFVAKKRAERVKKED